MRLMIVSLLVLFLASSLYSDEPEKEKEIQKGIAAAFPFDAAIQRHPAVIFASGFENGFQGWTLDGRDRKISSIATNRELAHSGTRCAASVAVKNVNEGGNISYFFPRGVDQVYVRFYCRFDKDTVWPHHFVKIRA